MVVEELQKITQSVLSELQKAQANQTSSIAYIRHMLPEKSLVEEGEQFQILVIGGTVLRSALGVKKGKQVKIVHNERSTPPQFDTVQSFFDCIFAYIDPTVSVLSLNFAYPLEPVYENGVLDGVLVSGTKENIFTGLVGLQVGKVIAEEFYRRYKKTLTVSVANDTVCLLLSGVSKYNPDSLIGGIVGTGVNFALFDNAHAVNLEAANFNKFTQTRVGILLDQQSEHPGKSQFEKVISGAYLYKYYNNSLAVNEPDFVPVSSTQELEQLGKLDTKLGKIARNTFQYSAHLVASFIAGLAEFKQTNCTAVMEGSLFWKADNYKSMVESTVAQLTEYTVDFQKIDEDSIKGAGMLVI